MRGAFKFYRRWLWRTIASAPSKADGLASLAGTGIASAKHYDPRVQTMTEDWLWQLPIWAFGAVLVVRFLAAPYSLFREGGGIDEQLRVSRERAFHASRYVEALAGEASQGRTPPFDASAFKVCAEGLERAMGSHLPASLVTAFEDMVYVVDRTREIISSFGDLAELDALATRARQNLAAIDAKLA